MNIEPRLYIFGGMLYVINPDQPGKAAKPYLQAWQEANGIEDGTPVVLCPHDQAQAVEDYLEQQRQQGRNTPLTTEA